LANQIPDGPCSSGLENIYLLNNSVPELEMDEIDLGVNFLGKRLRMPIVINAITGGTEQAGHINRALSLTAARHGIAMAVGSQTIAVDDPGLRYTFSVVREVNPEGLIFANVSAGSGISEAIEAVDMINADALQVHFNIPQELAMVEGERAFKGVISKVQRISEKCQVPVIAKEVGFGFSRESIKSLYDAGVTIFDIGGKGGTNFIHIEDQRSGKFAGELDDWGIPTAVSLAEAVNLNLPLQLIASGGIRTALDAVKSLALGADLLGLAGSVLKVLLEQGTDELQKILEEMVYRMKAIFLMTGSKNVEELRKKPIIILNETADWFNALGIDVSRWSRKK